MISKIFGNCLLHQTRVASNVRPISSSALQASSATVAERMGTAGIAAAAQVAAAAVNAAVSMRSLEAPDDKKSYVSKDAVSPDRMGVVDEVGLPLVYDKELIQKYWKKQGSALSQRWTEFLGYAVPYLTRVLTLVVSGNGELQKNSASLAKDARVIMEKLGPTYIKLGQMMSVRPDVLPQEALVELKALQDSVKPFDTKTAVESIEKELGGPLGQFFSEISETPVAAASLAQVYRARIASTGEYVAVKVQRPKVLEVVSKDLYVLRRAAEVYQGLIDRFAPQQRTNYVALLNEWAVGFYTELDFINEAANQERLKSLLQAENVTGVYVPKVYHELCTRRVMVSEWVEGIKLSDCSPEIIGQVTADAQEAFLTQLLQVGFFHADPHPGNIMYLNTPKDGAKLALIDFGLVASVQQVDMDTMVSAILHLANRDYASLVNDFIALGILPQDCDRALVVPLMDKALTPYVKGGGAKKYEDELRKTYGLDGSFSGTTGGFQAMTQDALTVLNDIPFSIPPYFALLGRAIVTLEGVALTGNPNYGIILEAYPFVARKLLKEDRPEIQKALQEVLYGKGGESMRGTRLSVLINSAMGIVAKNSGTIMDLDAIPEDTVDIGSAIRFLLSENTTSLRILLEEEAVTASDILLRQATRKAFTTLSTVLPRPPFIGRVFGRWAEVKVPWLLPQSNGGMTLLMQSADEMLQTLAPPLSREEELYALALNDAALQSAGKDVATVISGDAVLEPQAAGRLLIRILSSATNSQQLSSLVAEGSAQLLVLLGDNKQNTDSTSPENTVLDVSRTIQTLSEKERFQLQTFVSSVLRTLRDRLINRVGSIKNVVF